MVQTGREAGFANKLGAAGHPPAQAFACICTAS